MQSHRHRSLLSIALLAWALTACAKHHVLMLEEEPTAPGMDLEPGGPSAPEPDAASEVPDAPDAL